MEMIRGLHGRETLQRWILFRVRLINRAGGSERRASAR
jgi:hypothetical protein